MDNNGRPPYIPPTPEAPKDTGNFKSYWSAQSNVRMHRHDGVEIIFANHFFESKFEADQVYLDGEIRHGSQFVRYATEEETKVARFHKDPRGETRKELLEDPELMEQLRAKWELEQQGKNNLPGETSSSTGTIHGDGVKIALDGVKTSDPVTRHKTAADIAEDIRAKQAAAKEANNIGNSTEQKLKPVSTSQLGDGASGSLNESSAGGVAKK